MKISDLIKFNDDAKEACKNQKISMNKKIGDSPFNPTKECRDAQEKFYRNFVTLVRTHVIYNENQMLEQLKLLLKDNDDAEDLCFNKQ